MVLQNCFLLTTPSVKNAFTPLLLDDDNFSYDCGAIDNIEFYLFTCNNFWGVLFEIFLFYV